MSLENFRANNSVQAAAFRKKVMNRFLFRFFMLVKLPMAFIAGLRVVNFTPQQCAISVPYKWLNQNPFKSTYFAVLSMAAEMSSGMIALMHTTNAQPSISMLVTKLEAEFVKKATTITTFTCEDGDAILQTIEKAILTGQGQSCTCTAIGRSVTGELEAKFLVTWSFKART